MIIHTIKRRLHHDIVADPILHARVLNLYLCGEAYPHQVDDYFPIRHVQCSDLASKMRNHLAEEDKHVALYSKAIKKLGAQVIQLPNDCIFNHVIRGQTANPWAVQPTDKQDQVNDRVANFLAHAHFLERRIARSLEFHLEACAQASTDYAAKAVAAVLQDEQGHVTYTAAAIYDLVPTQRAKTILASHAQSERRANLEFSAGQLKRLLFEESDRWPVQRKPIYQACAFAMREVLHLV
jgi:hypothetical protein